MGKTHLTKILMVFEPIASYQSYTWAYRKKSKRYRTRYTRLR